MWILETVIFDFGKHLLKRNVTFYYLQTYKNVFNLFTHELVGI